MSARGMQFSKYHGLGNDYIVVDPTHFALACTPEEVRAICDRNYGPGSDGILYGPLHDAPGARAPRLRIFNPDGSEAEKSGNGVRIFAAYLVERGLVDPAGFSIATKGGTVSARLVDAAAGMYRVDMGPADFSARRHHLCTDDHEFIDRPLRLDDREFRATAVSMGNPHCVLLVDATGPDLARRYGPLAECEALFPERTNVQFMQVLARDEIRIEIWERGAGYTLASGSSSCAAASAARRLGLTGGTVKVRMPGGTIVVEMTDDTVFMTGPVKKIYEGRFAPDFLASIGRT